MRSDIVRGVRKIAVLRANGIGDYVFALPALDALRAAYPNAEITLLGLPWHRDFLQGRPGPVDRVVVVPPSRGVRDTSPLDPTTDSPLLDAFFAELRAESFDLALQLHGGGDNSNPFVCRLGARHTAGFRTPSAPPLDRWTRYDYWQREVLRLLEGVGLVGAAPVVLEPVLAVTPEDRAEADLVLARQTRDRALVALHPGSSDIRRRWPAERFAEVGQALARNGATIVVTGGPEERAVTEVVTSPIPGARDLTGALTLGGLAGLFAGCDLVISNDSGPLHLARAVGTATVGLYWCGNVVNAGPMTQARHWSLLSWTCACPACGRQQGAGAPCSCQVSFVDKISTPQVIDAACEALRFS